MSPLTSNLVRTGGKHYPYMKEGNVPLYVHKKSNHPPSILKNIPESINKRLSEISSDKESLEKAKDTYQDALNKSGYNYNLSYKNAPPETKHRKNRPRNITWFNPPYSQNVKTKVGKCFLTLIDKHFPKSNPLHRIFNRNTLKLSYSCMNNVTTIKPCPFKLSTLAIAATKGPALWTESVTSAISSIKQKSQHRTQSKPTLVLAIHHSNRVTETIHVPSQMNGTEMPLS